MRELSIRAEANERAAWEKTAWIAFCFNHSEGQTPDDFNPILIAEKAVRAERESSAPAKVPERTPAEIAKRMQDLGDKV